MLENITTRQGVVNESNTSPTKAWLAGPQFQEGQNAMNPCEGTLLSGLRRSNRLCPSPRPDQPHRLIALEQIEQHPQRLPTLVREARITREHQRGVVARRGHQVAVHVRARDAEARQAALAGAEHVALAAQ